MADLPRKQQEYFNQIKKALGSDDEEMLADLVRNKDALAIREDLSTTLGQHVNENYDNPLNIFEKKELLEKIPVHYTNDLPPNIAGSHRYVKDPSGLYSQEGTGIFLKPNNTDTMNRQIGTKVHEYGHANDLINDSDFMSKGGPGSSLKKLEGLMNAQNTIGKHHASGFFEKEALRDLLKNKKLKMIAPLAIGASALGIGNKAYAGDFRGAASDTGELVSDYTPIIGDIKGEELGNAELPPEEMIERERFNKIRQRLLNK